MANPTPLSAAVSTFGTACKAKLAGPGDKEAAIRAPLEALLTAAGSLIGVTATFHDEVSDTERRVRPDYGVSVKGAITGYIEVKAPGHGIDPEGFTGHDKEQWERQRDLPNLIYTNGTEWRLYRDNELLDGPVNFDGGPLATAGNHLSAPAEFETLVTDFLKWHPAPITSVSALVRAIAPLTRLLRGEVLDQFVAERRAIKAGAEPDAQPFHGLAHDWRTLLFPHADDKTFADGYAQTVTFALLLARTEGIEVTGRKLHEIGDDLNAGHSLMGRALQLLTDSVAADFKVTLDILVRVIGAVDWPAIRKGKRDTYLHLYESFLEEYDNDLRKRSGSYYTPVELVEEMVRLAEEALISRLGKPTGFRDPHVLTVDPAMGTGTFLQTIIERVARQAAYADGPGAVPGAVSQVASRIVGFEIQMGPYAVAELRATDLLASHGASTPKDGMRIYVTDTLDDPFAAQEHLQFAVQLIATQRKKANKVKAEENVTVVIGNPPYRERAEGMGGWVENGSATHRAILDDFRFAGNGKHERHLKNLYAYFWRWATWKVWESTPSASDGSAGVVCFISTSGYLRGPGFRGMRKYLREYASEGWIIDLTPEGQTPDVPTRIFPGVRQPLAIGIFVRKQDKKPSLAARVHFRAVSGTQAEKFSAIRSICLDDAGWRDSRTGWTAPLTPAPSTAWDDHPALGDVWPWVGPGIKASRTWIFAPAPAILEARWNSLISETDRARRIEKFRETPGVTLDRIADPLPGQDVAHPTGSFATESGSLPNPVRTGYRSFDRQWVIPDSRLMQRPGPLWQSRIPGQVFTIEQHSHPISSGPGAVFTALIPDLDHFKGSEGGRALPLLHPDGTPNLAPGLLAAWSGALAAPASVEDVLAYVAAVVAHPGFTATFADELVTPGIRVPITADPALFAEAVELGRQVVWAHTYGARFIAPDRPENNVRYPHGDRRQPLNQRAIMNMPTSVQYDEVRQVVVLGGGEFGPVQPAVWDYDVGGKNVIGSWVNYRKTPPGGKKTSPLDYIHVDQWDPDWTTELIDLLTVLTRLVELEPAQADLLARVLAGPTLSMADLAKAGVKWPTTAAHRKPHYPMEFSGLAGEKGA